MFTIYLPKLVNILIKFYRLESEKKINDKRNFFKACQ